MEALNNTVVVEKARTAQSTAPALEALAAAVGALRIEAEHIEAEAEKEAAHASALVVKDAGSYASAVESMKAMSKLHRDAESKRKSATKPLDEVKKTLMDWFRSPLDKLSTSIESLREQLKAYDAQQLAIERVAAEEAARYIKAGDRAAAEAVVTAGFANSVGDVAGVTRATVWDFEITNAAEIPREYLMVDEAKIRAVVVALKQDAKIAGVRAFPTTQVKVRQ